MYEILCIRSPRAVDAATVGHQRDCVNTKKAIYTTSRTPCPFLSSCIPQPPDPQCCPHLSIANKCPIATPIQPVTSSYPISKGPPCLGKSETSACDFNASYTSISRVSNQQQMPARTEGRREEKEERKKKTTCLLHPPPILPIKRIPRP